MSMSLRSCSFAGRKGKCKNKDGGISLKRGIIDRFEGEFAIVECNGGFERVKRSQLPPTAKEGDAVVWDRQIVIDKGETDNRIKLIKGLMEKLFR